MVKAAIASCPSRAHPEGVDDIVEGHCGHRGHPEQAQAEKKPAQRRVAQSFGTLGKHFYTVEALPVNEYLSEPGVVLVNRYAELKEKASEIEEELGKGKEAILEYARREQVEMIKGSDRKARVRFDKSLKFPGKNEAERKELDDTLVESGKWMEVSQLDTTALARIMKEGLLDEMNRK